MSVRNTVVLQLGDKLITKGKMSQSPVAFHLQQMSGRITETSISPSNLAHAYNIMLSVTHSSDFHSVMVETKQNPLNYPQ